MSTITEFLLARISEDEGQARGVLEELEACPPSAYDVAQVPLLDAGDPDRVLAECEAKRRIVEVAWTQEWVADGEWGSSRSIEQMKADGILPPILCALASVYADHPDFQDEWRNA